MSILRCVIESHEGKKENIPVLLEKYNISQDNMKNTLNLISILRDADALDRARLSSKKHMNLKTKFLTEKASKGLIDFSFQLEKLTRKFPDFLSILNYDKKEISENRYITQSMEDEKTAFFERIQVTKNINKQNQQSQIENSQTDSLEKFSKIHEDEQESR